jgi:hypothetical protein
MEALDGMTPVSIRTTTGMKRRARMIEEVQGRSAARAKLSESHLSWVVVPL